MQAGPDAEAGEQRAGLRRPWPILAAALAGPLVHGAGHLTAGQKRTGLRLLYAEGGGLAAIVAGLAGLALTGASEKTVLPFIGLTAVGMGLFSASLLADLYGVLAPEGGFGTPVARPALVLEAGLQQVIDPIFPYDVFAHVGGRAFFGRHFVDLRTHVALDHDNQRVRAIYGLRMAQWEPASYLELELGAVHHNYGAEAFSTTFGEVALGGRLSLHHVGPSLAGAFVEGAIGVALGGHRYFDVTTEFDSMTLLRLGFGAFVGDGGEWRLYYDHRHDGFAAGMKMRGLGSGVIGHVGTALSYYFDESWGVSAFAETGSAHVFGLAALYRRKRL